MTFKEFFERACSCFDGEGKGDIARSNGSFFQAYYDQFQPIFLAGIPDDEAESLHHAKYMPCRSGCVLCQCVQSNKVWYKRP